ASNGHDISFKTFDASYLPNMLGASTRGQRLVFGFIRLQFAFCISIIRSDDSIAFKGNLHKLLKGEHILGLTNWMIILASLGPIFHILEDRKSKFAPKTSTGQVEVSCDDEAQVDEPPQDDDNDQGGDANNQDKEDEDITLLVEEALQDSDWVVWHLEPNGFIKWTMICLYAKFMLMILYLGLLTNLHVKSLYFLGFQYTQDILNKFGMKGSTFDLIGYSDGDIEISYINTKDQLADIFTNSFIYLDHGIGVFGEDKGFHSFFKEYFHLISYCAQKGEKVFNYAFLYLLWFFALVFFLVIKHSLQELYLQPVHTVLNEFILVLTDIHVALLQ
ncbi:hypothetical protein ACJX0J_016677, partial [Zea mays]